MRLISKVTMAVAAAVWSIAASGGNLGFDLEWCRRYDPAIPYEVELIPAKLERLAGVKPGSGFAVKADGRVIESSAFAGKAPGSVVLRFRVPSGTAHLACEASVGELNLADSSAIDNLFAGALDSGSVRKWQLPDGVSATSEVGGILFADTKFRKCVASYRVDVPPSLAGRSVKVEFDVENRSEMVWGGLLRVVQIDAGGQPLQESLSDPRWTSHMRPVGRRISYREEGTIHPRARRLRLDVELKSRFVDVDSYGLPAKDRSGALPRLLVSHVAVRPAVSLPFPRLNDVFFGEGVSGEPGDCALALGGPHLAGFWYQTHSQACWAEGKSSRDERDCFFPAKSGTVEAWFNVDWSGMAGEEATLFQYHQGYSMSERRQGRGSFLILRWDRKVRKVSLEMLDAMHRKFAGKAPLDLPSGRWTHVAVQWNPGGEAQVFVDGRAVLSVPLAGFRAFDIEDEKIRNPDDLAGMEFFVGCSSAGTRSAKSFIPDRRYPMVEGLVDALRVSSGCRYAAGFTPEKVFRVDDDTRALFNFDRTFDGASGGGVGFIPGCFRAAVDRVDHALAIGGRKVRYYPAENVKGNDPSAVFDICNYPVMPRADEYTAARREVRRSFDLSPGGRATYETPAGSYPDFVEIANVGSSPLVYPIVIGKGELDVRSFGDLKDSLSLGGASDRGKVDRLFQLVISASDYFMNHNAVFPYGSDEPKCVCYDAMLVLNSYCGFECGPLNNLAANLFAAVAECPSAQTGGYGHNFQEVFYDGKNHLYDLSAQKFMPAMDNETVAYLREAADQPGVFARVGAAADSYIRKGVRNFAVQNPDYRGKVGVTLNPGEAFRVWHGNNGEGNNLQCKSMYIYPEQSRWSTPASRTSAPRYERETGATEMTNPIRRIDRFFPDYSSGFITFSGRPQPDNAAFVNVNADSFCYGVRSGYPITWARYRARRSDGSVAALEISTDFKTFRTLPPPGEDGMTELVYPVRARHGYWIRVRAPIAAIAQFDATTEVQVNRRTFPGHARPGANEITLKAVSGDLARVSVQWRENVRQMRFSGGVFSGTIPGFERQTVLLDPAIPLSLDVEGVSSSAKVSATKGLAASLSGGRLTITSENAAAEPFTGFVELDDGGAKRELTVIACHGARLALASDGVLTGGAEKVVPDSDRVQAAAMLRRHGDGVRLRFAGIAAGDYVVMNCERFPGGKVKDTARVLEFHRPGAAVDEPWIASGAAANGNCDYLKAAYAHPGERGNWKWDYPFLEDDRGASWNGWEMLEMPFAATGELEYRLGADRPDGVEFVAALIFPASVTKDFRGEVKKLLCGLNCQPSRIR